MGAEQAGEWDTATPLIWKQSEGSSWRTRVPPPLPAAPVTAQRFLQEDLYGIKKKEEREAEAQAALEANSEGSLTRPKKAIPPGCGDAAEEEDESILDTVIKYLPGPLQDIFKK
ncbi:complexin-1 isoform X1 [Bos taurus]|uniref:complexin-1 isoform X1 n=1 Tax=Bos taurus TaxID=9913 RepID=UPI0028CB31EE|nr:complexin-1 isoform X1 [Bos taurus]